MDVKKSRLKNRVSFLFLNLFLLSCNIAVENPEKLDPIYLDLLKEKKTYEDLISELKHQKTLAVKKQTRMQDRTLEIKLNKSSIKKLNTKIKKYNQKILYYRIKVKQRLEYARKNYLIALKKKKKWPDPKEYEAYLRSKKLKNAPRKWNRRTPTFNKKQEENNPLDSQTTPSSSKEKGASEKKKH